MTSKFSSAALSQLAKNKKYWIFGGLAVLLLAAFILLIQPAGKKADSRPFIPGLSTADAQGSQPGSYAAANYPTINASDNIFGSQDAPLPIFVYEDYTSPYSAALADTLDRIKAESGNKVAIIVRPYIVGNSLSSYQAAAAVDCAGAQGKWAEMRALLLARAKNQQLAAINFDDFARQIGLNQNNFDECLTNEAKSGKIEQSEAQADAYKVQGAPTMFIGGEMILGARPYNDFIDSNGDKIQGLKTVVDQKLKGI